MFFLLILCYAEEIIKLYPYQDYVATTNYDHVEVEGCKSLVAFVYKEQREFDYSDNLNNVPEMINIKKVAITVGNEQTYCFCVLYNKTFIQFMQDKPQFFFKDNYLGLEFDLAKFNSTNSQVQIKICYDLFRTLENQRFYLLCSDREQYRIFVEIEFNFTCLNTTENKDILKNSIKTYILEDISNDEVFSTRYIYKQEEKIVILFNSKNSIYFHCNNTCHKLQTQNSQNCKISDIQLSYFEQDSFQLVQSCFQEGLFFMSYNLTDNQLKNDNIFRSYDGELYLSLSLYKQNLQYGIEPILVYPEISLLTSNFIYSFYLFKKNDQEINKNNQIFTNKVRIKQLDNRFPQELSQDESYFYIYQAQFGNYSITQYSKFPPLRNETYQINHTYKNIQPQFTFFDTKNYLSTQHKQNIAIYQYNSRWEYKQFKIIRNTLNLRAQNHKYPKNCTLKFDNNESIIQVQLILLYNQEIIKNQQKKIEEYSDVIRINLDDYFEGQMIEYKVRSKSRRLSNYYVVQNHQTTFPDRLTLDTQQSHDVPTKIKAIYDSDSNLGYTICQGSNRKVYVLKGIEVIAQYQAFGDLVNYEKYGNQLVYSLKDISQTQIITKIYDINLNSTREIKFPNDEQINNFQVIKNIDIFTSPYQKNLYYLVNSDEKQFLYYYNYEQIQDQNFEQFCFEVEFYKMESLDLTLSQQNLYFAFGMVHSFNISEIVYFRLPIQKQKDSCGKILPTKLQFDSNSSRQRSLDFRIVDFRFIDYSKPPAILIFDLELNTLTMHYLRDLFNIDYKREGLQLPLFLNNLNLSFLHSMTSFPVGYNSYSTFGSMNYAIVNFQYLLLQITDCIDFYEIQIYDLLEVSGNQVRKIQTKFDSENLHYIIYSHLIQKTANVFKNTINFVKLKLENNPLESSYNNISFYTQFDPLLILNLDQSLQSSKIQIFQFEIIANNSYDRKIYNLDIQFNLQGLVVQPNFYGTKELDNLDEQVNFNLVLGSVKNNYIYYNKIKTIINLVELKDINQNCNFTNNSILFSYKKDLFYFFDQVIYKCNTIYANTNNVTYDNAKMIECNSYKFILLHNDQHILLCIDKVCDHDHKYDNQLIKSTDMVCMEGTLIIAVLISFDYNDNYEDDQVIFYIDNLNNPNDFKINAKTFEEQLNYIFTSLNIYVVGNQLEIFLKQRQNKNYLISLDINNQSINLSSNKSYIQYYRQDEQNVFYSESLNYINKKGTNLTYNQYYYCQKIDMNPYYLNDSFIQFLNCSDIFSIAYYINSFTSQVFPVISFNEYKYSWIYDNQLYVALSNHSLSNDSLSNHSIMTYAFNHKINYSKLTNQSQFQQCSSSQTKDLKYTCIDIVIKTSQEYLDDQRDTINEYFFFLIIPVYALSIIGNLVFFFQIKKIPQDNKTSSIEFNQSNVHSSNDQ